METMPEIYPLTGLQIGDIKSYLSRAFLYFDPFSSRFLILIDNRPWLMNTHSRSTRLWQLMVTKYRMSPFTNTRKLHKASNMGSKIERKGDHKYKSFDRWFPVIKFTKWQEKSLFSVMDLSKDLHGFIVFEVAWKDVHGINYSNELQTDTSIAVEVKFMKKWEFNSAEQASSCISSWFSGRTTEIKSLENSLTKLSDLDLHHWNSHPSSKEIFLDSQSPSEVFPEDKFLDVQESPLEPDGSDNISICKLGICEEKKQLKCGEIYNIASTQYADALLVFRFSDSILPFKLRQVITSDLRLLTLLESGLPSWAIFLQSFPLFCHFYRPWMRPLARTFYILISLVTVIIGFYDLYKNVPLLKATAARLCGPLFSWIEAWDMVSRIRYLGTMLFLQNFDKSFRWFLRMARAIRPLLAVITKPLMEPLSDVTEFFSPVWNVCAEMGEQVFSTLRFMIESMYSGLLDLIDVLLWPFEFLYSYIWDIVYPLLCSIWELFLAPIRFVITLANYMASLLSNIYDLLKDVWESASSIFPLTSFSEAKQGAYEISIWRGLWNDLFSQVFRATRSIINGLMAFFMTCNRHRLSIYNHMQEYLQRVARLICLAPHTCHCQQTPQMEHHNVEDYKECDRCK